MGELTNIVGNTHFLHNKPYPIKNSGLLGNQLMNLDKNKRVLNFRNNHTIKSSSHDEIIKLLNY